MVDVAEDGTSSKEGIVGVVEFDAEGMNETLRVVAGGQCGNDGLEVEVGESGNGGVLQSLDDGVGLGITPSATA